MTSGVIIFFKKPYGREIEVQTQCNLSIQLKSTWKDGKMWEYKSDRVVHEEEEAPPQLPMANSIVASPQKRHVTVPNSKHFENVNSNECRICGETGEKSFWIGCSHKNKLSGRQDCNY